MPMNLLNLLLPLIIGLTWVRLARPGNGIQGDVIHIERLPVLARIRMHAVPGVLAMAVAGALVGLSLAPVWVILLPLISNALLIGIPVSYVLTDEGIRLGWTGFRRWTEFAGVQRAAGGARLMGVNGRRGMHIWLSGARGDDEFLAYLRQTVRNAYKGNARSDGYSSWKSRANKGPQNTGSAPISTASVSCVTSPDAKK